MRWSYKSSQQSYQWRERMDSILLKGLSKKEKESFLAIFTQKNIAQGETIKKEGEALKKAFFLTEGEIGLRKISSEEEMEVATIKGGDDTFFSLACMLLSGKSLTTVVAKKECKILEILQEDFYQFCEENEIIGIKILRNTTQMLTSFLQKSDVKIAEMYKTLEEVL